MESLAEKTKLKTLKPSSMRESSPFVFPPRRRAHLKSETFRTLVRIFSVCIHESQCSVLESIPEASKSGVGDNELGQRSGHEVQDELVEHESIGPEDWMIEKIFVFDKNTDVIANRRGESDPVRMVTDELENRMGIEGNEELVVRSFVERDLIANDAALVNNKYDHFSFERIGISQTMNLSSDNSDVTMEELKSGDDTEDKTFSFEQTVLEELDHGMQQKENELKESFSSGCVLGSSVSLIADREIEDGEISDELGISDESVDMLFEDVGIFEEGKAEEQHISGDFSRGEKYQGTCYDQEGADNRDKASTPYRVSVMDYKDSSNQEQLNESKGRDMKQKADMLAHDKTGNIRLTYEDGRMLEAGQKDPKDAQTRGHANFSTASNGLGLHGEVLEEIMTENEGIVSTLKDVEVDKRKKRGPKTQEGKAKKKMKERKRRAKKNKLLGVKRLKLQPIVKPKTVKYCDYYLKGRCQKGELCTYSHDTIPLTKSQPCIHFARHSCMKGDDCPFDHQLSKYPCTKYVSTGFCSRGDNCLFSHKVPVDTSGVNERELESSSMMDKTDSMKQLNLIDTSHPTVINLSKDTTKTSSFTGMNLDRKTDQNTAEMRVKPPMQAPKGINFLSFGKAPLNNSSEQQQGESSSKGNENENENENEIAVYNQKSQTASEKHKNSNDMPWKTQAALVPRGISFLAIGAPLDNSNKQQQLDILSIKNVGIEISNQKSQSAPDKREKSNEMPWKTPKYPVPLFHSSNPSADGFNTNTPSSVQKSLLSTLSFGAKFESETKKKDLSSANTDKLSSGSSNGCSSSCDSGGLKGEPMKASKILEDFLFGFGRNNKQQ